MTMATYNSKNRPTKTSSKLKKPKSASSIQNVNHKLPLDLKISLVVEKPPEINKSCNQGNSRPYAVLEALGLTRINATYEVFIDDNDKAALCNNNDLKLRNNNIHPDNIKSTPTTKLHEYNKSNFNLKMIDKYNGSCKPNQTRSKILFCKICSKMFQNSDLLLQHKKCHSGDQPYCCIQCNKTFEALQYLRAHVRRHEGKLPYICKICKTGFNVYSDLINHQTVHLIRKSDFVKSKLYKCTYCSKEFSKYCDLERHKRVHTGEKPYICQICKNRFQQGHNLTKHMIIHTKEKQFKCEICKKEFGRSDVLTRHMITHSVNKPHQCEFCEKSFGRVSQLVDHVNKYHFKLTGYV